MLTVFMIMFNEREATVLTTPGLPTTADSDSSLNMTASMELKQRPDRK